ncbi:MAG: hypothetical protein AAB738_02920 [Patescibacteria group bacterium]
MDQLFVISGILALTGRLYWRLLSLGAVLGKVALLAQVFHEAARESTRLEYEDRFLGFRVSFEKKEERPFDPHEDIYDQGRLDAGETKFFSQ